jgi:hypothetical protein
MRFPSSLEAAEKYVERFLQPDFVSSPQYAKNPAATQDLLHMRNDSRGQPLRRTILGGSKNYFEAKSLKDSKNLA